MRFLADLTAEEQARENITTMIRENAIAFLIPVTGALVWLAIKTFTGWSFISIFKEPEEVDPKNFD